MTASHAKIDPDAGHSARGSSFYSAMRIMPPKQRSAMYEIYRFCRAVDDIADGAGAVEQRLSQLQQWRDDLAFVYAGNPPPHLSRLALAVNAFALRREDFLAVIDGMEMDVRGPIQAPDFATLELYCDRVASAVGRLSVRVFGLAESDGLDLSHHLGLALQLTNILRDLDEDAQMGRLYLPRELLLQAAISEGSPAQIVGHPAIGNACALLAGKALYHFDAADSMMFRHSRKKMRTPRVMSQAYRAIHKALVERGFSAPRAPVHLGKVRLGFILLRNILF